MKDTQEQEKQLHEKYMQFQILQQQSEQLSKYLEELEQKHLEFDQTIQGLKDFAKTPSDTETLIPIAAGIFAEGKTNQSQELIVNVGADILVKKSPTQVIDMISKQTEEIEQVQLKVSQDINKINLQINTLLKEIQEIS